MYVYNIIFVHITFIRHQHLRSSFIILPLCFLPVSSGTPITPSTSTTDGSTSTTTVTSPTTTVSVPTRSSGSRATLLSYSLLIVALSLALCIWLVEYWPCTYTFCFHALDSCAIFVTIHHNSLQTLSHSYMLVRPWFPKTHFFYITELPCCIIFTSAHCDMCVIIANLLL